MNLRDLEIPLTEIKGIGDRTAEKLIKNKIKTVRDLIYYFPYKYLDLTQVKKISEVKIGETVVLVARLTNLKFFSSPRKKIFLVQGILSDKSGSLKVVWYNQRFLLNILKGNPLLLVYGKVVKNNFGINLQSPKFEVLKSEKDFQGKIIPVYSEIEGLKTSFFNKLLQELLKKYNLRNLSDPLPRVILKKLNYPSLGEAIIALHQPQALTEVKLAEERLSFEELLYFEMAEFLERKNIEKNKAPIIKENDRLINKFLINSKLQLTNGQKKVLDEIFNDLGRGFPMNRLLQGETGSGKTLIAEIVALNFINYYQVIFMAPTEILAQQHFQRFVKDFSCFDYGLGLLTSGQIFYAERGFKIRKAFSIFNKFLSLGKIKIIIGTHSLIENSLSFQKVGLIIIDEQQRFGVEQRKKLIDQTNQNFSPHFLSMTATPIPRTLALAFYSDLDFSYLEEKPFGQKFVKTYLVFPSKEKVVWRFVIKEINEGHQVFVICPRVEKAKLHNQESSIEDEIKSVKTEYERIQKILPRAKIAMLHGKMKAEEKESILKKMQKNEINVLVASSVVEVGIDLPLATVIIIEAPERFGLAQLYQLRGRVGRSVHQGYCFLMPQKLSSKSKLRLKYFLQAKSALELSEYDLKLRGSGELFGEKQSGIPDFAMKSLTKINLVNQAKKIAEEFIKKINLEKHPELLNEINKRKKILYF